MGDGRHTRQAKNKQNKIYTAFERGGGCERVSFLHAAVGTVSTGTDTVGWRLPPLDASPFVLPAAERRIAVRTTHDSRCTDGWMKE